MFTIAKEFTFSAAHHLTKVPDGHPCKRPHGHNYTVTLILEAFTLNEMGFVVDYNELKLFKEMLDSNFDHRDLNEVFDAEPTAEHLAQYFFYWAHIAWPEVMAVRVSETDKTYAEYRPEYVQPANP